MSNAIIGSERLVENLVSQSIKTDITALCRSMEPIRFKNFDGRDMLFEPDDGIGFFEFQYSFGFPIRNVYGTGLYPAVIAASFKSIVNKYLNYEHQMKHYEKEKDDRIIGHIVAANFPDAPNSDGWKIDANNIPYVTAVACFYKRCQGLNRILGEHVTGKHTWAVSMEVDWAMDDCGFAVKIGSGAPRFTFTPPDFLKIGYEYIPFANAPADLIATYSKKANRINSQWKGREVTLLMGGLNTPLHYAGVALVKSGAERQANIQHLTASAPKNPLIEAMNDLPALFREAMLSKIIKKNPDPASLK